MGGHFGEIYVSARCSEQEPNLRILTKEHGRENRKIMRTCKVFVTPGRRQTFFFVSAGDPFVFASGTSVVTFCV